MLKIAVPNKGALAEAAVAMLAEAGYHQRRSSRDLVIRDVDNDVEFFYLRPRDIAVYVGEGTLDVGITGRDLLLDSGADADEVKGLGFGRSSFRFAVPAGTMSEVSDFDGRRIATSYATVVRAYLSERGIDTHVVRLDGAVESAIRLGVADAIADVVETGSTLRQAGLEVIGDPILESEAVLIRPNNANETSAYDVFERRLQGVLVARAYVMMDYDIRTEHVERAVALTPGIESPTVSPLHREGWVAVRSMVRRDAAQKVMDELWALGARGTLVTDILACRL
ncbi:ATP phosphoribosyltransferase [Solicola gregarius]|uniref:ATP phosphoribosyltransferase n=1 Tax=Solicola gregarius TaxID=2908642 RepID=A0AA46YL71_9ACTN|nr:ATP phosphoribosyltransferase [Solicola gregarius]UYM05231.1 ATP phosphoribosyltransferase [Solicola gregarius]